jgi:hypothetical protein
MIWVVHFAPHDSQLKRFSATTVETVVAGISTSWTDDTVRR